jgi:hypothetical protein
VIWVIWVIWAIWEIWAVSERGNADTAKQNKHTTRFIWGESPSNRGEGPVGWKRILPEWRTGPGPVRACGASIKKRRGEGSFSVTVPRLELLRSHFCAN